MQVGHGRPRPAAHQVEALVHLAERLGDQRFQADQHPLAAAAPHQFERLVVERHVYRRLADPADPQRDQGPHQLLGVIQRRRQVVVDEEHELPPRAGAAHLVHHAIDRAMGVRRRVVRLDGAEIAAKPAATGELDQPQRQVALAAKDGPVGTGCRAPRPVLRSIDGLRPAMPMVVDDLREHALRLADDDRFAVGDHLVGAERGVEAAHHDGHAAAAVFAGDLIRPFRRVGFDADQDEIRGLVERDRLHPIVMEPPLDVGGQQRRQHGRRQRLHLPAPHVAAHAAKPAHARVHDGDAKAAALTGGRPGRETHDATSSGAASARRPAARGFIHTSHE